MVPCRPSIDRSKVRLPSLPTGTDLHRPIRARTSRVRFKPTPARVEAFKMAFPAGADDLEPEIRLDASATLRATKQEDPEDRARRERDKVLAAARQRLPEVERFAAEARARHEPFPAPLAPSSSQRVATAKVAPEVGPPVASPDALAARLRDAEGPPTLAAIGPNADQPSSDLTTLPLEAEEPANEVSEVMTSLATLLSSLRGEIAPQVAPVEPGPVAETPELAEGLELVEWPEPAAPRSIREELVRRARERRG